MSDQTPVQPSQTKTIVKIALFLAIVIIIGVIPFAVISGAVEWQAGVKAAVYGYVVGLVTCLLAPRRVSIELTVLFVAFVVAGALVSTSIFGLAIVITVGTVLIPIYAVRGYIRPAVLTSMMISNAVSPAIGLWPGESTKGPSFYLAVAGIVLAAGVWGILVATFIHSKAPKPDGPVPVPAEVSTRVAIAGGVALAIGTFLVAFVVGSHFPEHRWVWILAPLFSMMMAKSGTTLGLGRDLMIGAVLGAGIGVALVQLPLPLPFEMIFGLLVIATAIALQMVGLPYWIGASVSTAGVIILTGAGMDPSVAAQNRLAFGFFGAILAVLISGCIVLCMKWAAKNDPAATNGSGGTSNSNSAPTQSA